MAGRKRIGAMLWAVPVVLASLTFLPLWPFIAIALVGPAVTCGAALLSRPYLACRRMVSWLRPARWADGLVGRLARHKASLLVLAILVAIACVVLVVVELCEGKGKQLTHCVEIAGGYVAIAGLVLGLPALGYAMVTDRAVDQLSDRLGIDEDKIQHARGDIRARIDELLACWGNELDPHYYSVQVFVPNLNRTRLVALYDQHRDGPPEGWDIRAEAPQAVTGSAWVANRYVYVTGSELEQPGLRLTREQQARFARLKGVAAAPIREGRTRIGVLTIFTEKDPRSMRKKEFIKLHMQLAVGLSATVMASTAKPGLVPLPRIAPDDAPDNPSGIVKA